MLFRTIGRWLAIAAIGLLLVTVALPLIPSRSVVHAQGRPTGAYIQLDKTSGSVGTHVTATGGGYAPGKPVYIQIGQQDIGAPTVADGQGNIIMGFLIPTMDPGLYPVFATDGIDRASTPFTVTPSP